MQYVVVNAEPVSFFLFSIWIEVLTFICFVPVDPFLVSRITTVLGGCIHLPKNFKSMLTKFLTTPFEHVFFLSFYSSALY